MDEILISEEEINHTIRRNDYYVIRPILPELQSGTDDPAKVLSREFSSGDFVLDYNGTVELLRHNKLMIDDIAKSPIAELLR